jgi:putative CocE/NonD family hydrolase
MKRTSMLAAILVTLSSCGAPSRGHPSAAPASVVSAAVAPTTTAATSSPPEFTATPAMIPMRDGVKLESVIFAPRVAGKPLPFLLSRSPYGIPEPDPKIFAERSAPHLRKDGYIFVWQNIRGRFKSEGTFAMGRPPRDRKDEKATDESTDAYDTIEWLLHNVANNNGRAGMRGTSYAAWAATMALLDPHPALKAIAEASSPADQFVGDDFHHNGALRMSYCFEFATLLESAKDKNTPFLFDRLDTYDWFLALGTLANVNDRYFHGRVPSWNDFVDHPNLDEFWKQRSFDDYLKKTSVPTLNVAAWWDQEDFRGPQRIYELLEREDGGKLNYFLAGPWNHGGQNGPGHKLGDIDFGSDTGTFYRENVEGPWFAHWLQDRDTPPFPEAQVFVTGANRWQSFESWPPKKRVKPTKLHLREGRTLSFDAPPAGSARAFDEYISDPANPVPYVRRPIRTFSDSKSDWPVWEVQDQRFVDHRPDVLSWETDVLASDVVVAGEIVADLFASTSGSDSDWVVKLIDVYPEAGTPPDLGESEHGEKDPRPDMSGYQLIIASDVMRGRFRKDFSHPEPIVPGRIEEYKFSLQTHAHAFLKGHRIMVQVQSSWFPLIDRNPQKYIPNIAVAKEADFQKATQRIARSREAPSGLVLPILAL